MRVSRTKFAVIAAGVTFAWAVAPISAQELEPGVVLPEIAALRKSTVSATVVTLPKNVKFGLRMREKDMASHGCTYEVTDYEDLMSVIDVLDHASMRASGKPAMPLDLRFSIVLRARDGKETKMYARDLVMNNGTIDGLFGGIPVFVNAGFPVEIRAWAAKRKPSATGVNHTCV